MTKIICDRCGEDLTHRWWYTVKVTRETGDTSCRVVSDIPKESTFDLCGACAHALVEFIDLAGERRGE